MLSAYKILLFGKVISIKNIIACIMVIILLFVFFMGIEIYKFFKYKKIKGKYELEYGEQKKAYEELVKCLSDNKSTLDNRDTDYKYIMHDEAEIRRYLTTINNINAMDYLLEEKSKYARDCEISFSVLDFKIASFFDRFNQIDVLRLWANLVNNAIRGAGRGGFVRVEFENRSKDMDDLNGIIVRVSNNKAANGEIREGISDKKDDNTHGYGIKIVKEIVDSFGGSIEWIDKGDEVCVRMEFIGD